MTQQAHDADDKYADSLLAVARDTPPRVPGSLSARVETDALRFQPDPSDRMRRTYVFGGWAALARARVFGAFGGIVAASCVGFWIGFYPPMALLEMPLPGLQAPGANDIWEGTELSGFGWDVEGI